MDNEAQERKRLLNAARVRAHRERQKELLKDQPKKPRGGQRTDNPLFGRTIYLSVAEWEFCKAQPGSGSEFVRQLVIDYMAEHGEAAGAVKSEDGGPVD